MPTKPWDGRIQANALHIPLAHESVQMCITSPPYWGLRAYAIPDQIFGGDLECVHQFGEARRRGGPAGNHGGATSCRPGRANIPFQARQNDCLGSFCALCDAWKGQLGMEPDPYLYVDHMVEIFREVWRVLKPNGTLWLNLSDCYATGAGSVKDHPGGGKQGARWSGRDDSKGRGTPKRADGTGGHNYVGPMTQPNRMPIEGLKPKDLVGIPWRVALSLQADGWWLRSDIVWSKPSCMPESVTDRPTRSHEYVFLMSKSEQYYYDSIAIAELATSARESIYDNGLNGHGGGESHAGQGSSTRKFPSNPELKNKRSVWTINTQPYPEAHYATFPEELPAICIRAGSKPGDTVLDPFFGSGTVGLVAKRLGRRWIGLDLGYQDLQARRTAQEVLQFHA
jgi:DNA modification methylase